MATLGIQYNCQTTNAYMNHIMHVESEFQKLISPSGNGGQIYLNRWERNCYKRFSFIFNFRIFFHIQIFHMLFHWLIHTTLFSNSAKIYFFKSKPFTFESDYVSQHGWWSVFVIVDARQCKILRKQENLNSAKIQS